MKVLQINTVYPYGSTGKICYSISEYLYEKNVENIVCCRYNDNSLKTKENVYYISTWFDNHLHNRLSTITGLQFHFSTIRTIKFIKFIKKYNPDIIHLHNIFSNYINVGMLLKFLSESNIKVIWTLHDCIPFTGGCPYYVNFKCDGWKHSCSKCSYYSNIFLKKEIAKYNLYKKKKYVSKLKNITFVSVSKWLDNELKDSMLKNKKHCVIYNGIDLNVFKPLKCEKSELLKDKFVILGVANVWDNRKGFNKFIELSKKIDNNSIIVLIGLDDKQILSLPSNIIGLKRTNNVNELVYYYNIADVFINLSNEETFGLVSAEAQACGTPVILTNKTANPELIIDKKTGIILRNNTIPEIMNAIELIKKIKINKQKCVDYVNNNFSNDKMVSNYYVLYKEVLNEKN